MGRRINLILLAAALTLFGPGYCFAQIPVSISASGSPVAINPSGSPHLISSISTASDTLALAGWKYAVSTIPMIGDQGTMRVLNFGRSQDIQQDGTVEMVGVGTGIIPPGLTGYGVWIYRPAGVGVYNFVGMSENLAPRLQSSTFNQLALAQPITGAQIGDKVGYWVTAPGNTSNWLVGVNGEGTSVLANSAPGSSFNWDNSSLTTGIANKMAPIAIYMKAPWAVSLSNSIMEGVPTNFSWLDRAGTTVDKLNCVPCLLADSLHVGFRNHGKSGNQTYAMIARFPTHVRLYRPKVVLIEGGHNDINGFDGDIGLPVAQKFAPQIITNHKAIVDSVRAISGIPVYFAILPSAQLGTTQKAATADSVNTAMIAYVQSHGGYVIDLRATLGVFRSDGPAGNHWGINTTYFDVGDGGVHLTHAGAALAVNASLPTFRTIYSIIGP